MTNFRPDIHTNLSFYRGIIEDPDRIEALNMILNELEALGFDKLVQNFSTQRDPERASDILFEISICQLLRRHLDIQDLQYEPPGEEHPPDFRFQLRGVSFDLQVKQLYNTKNEMTKRLFERECRRHLSRLPKPWFINFWVADHFTRQHLNPFFACLKGSLDQCSPATTHDSMLGEPQYRWGQDGRTLVQFSVVLHRSCWPPDAMRLLPQKGTHTAEVNSQLGSCEMRAQRVKRTTTRNMARLAAANSISQATRVGGQFVASPEDHSISDEPRTLIAHRLRERLLRRGLGRAVGVSLPWRLHWMVEGCAAWPAHLQVGRPAGPTEVIIQPLAADADEMGSFAGKSANTPWSWSAMDAQTRQVIACQVGDRSHDSAKALWAKSPGADREQARLHTDQAEAYQGVMPVERHQAMTQHARNPKHIERFNNTLRQGLSRLVGET